MPQGVQVGIGNGFAVLVDCGGHAVTEVIPELMDGQASVLQAHVALALLRDASEMPVQSSNLDQKGPIALDA